jgi:hypothetical protein
MFARSYLAGERRSTQPAQEIGNRGNGFIDGPGDKRSKLAPTFGRHGERAEAVRGQQSDCRFTALSGERPGRHFAGPDGRPVAEHGGREPPLDAGDDFDDVLRQGRGP